MARIVLKIGSAVLTQDNAISLVRMQALVDLIKELRNKDSRRRHLLIENTCPIFS